MKKIYSINELCKLTRVSVRTLHHYDEINILKPSHRTPNGHRRYSEDELLRLQQIVTLKFMGFSLAEIKRILSQKDFNIFNSLKIQEKALLEQVDHIQRISKLINYLITQNELNQSIDWQTVIQIMEVLNKKDSQQWYERYLTEYEQEQFKRIGMQRKAKWQALFDEVKHSNIDPRDKEGLELVKKLLLLAKETYGDQPEFLHKLWEAFKAGIIPSQLTEDKFIVSYVTKAFEKMQEKGFDWKNL